MVARIPQAASERTAVETYVQVILGSTLVYRPLQQGRIGESLRATLPVKRTPHEEGKCWEESKTARTGNLVA